MQVALFVGVLSAAALAATTARAQQPVEDQTVIVTAQKRIQRADEVGMSISAFDGALLKDLGIDTVAGLAVAVPGMTFALSPFGLPIYTLRGMSTDDNQAAQQAPAVGIYVDQIALPYTLLTRGPQFDLERVEVLKGPQGTLFGQSTTGGAINYVTRKPGSAPEYGGSAGIDSLGAWGAEAYVGGPIAGALRGRLSALTRQGGAWQRSMSRDEKAGATDLSALRLQLEFGDEAGVVDALMAFNHWRDRSDLSAAQPNGLNLMRPTSPAAARLTGQVADDARDAEWTAPANRQPANPANERGYGLDQEFNSLSFTLSWKLGGGITLTSLTGGVRFTRDDMSGAVPLPQENDDIRETGAIDGFLQELRVAGHGDGIDWVAGIYLARDRVRSHQLNLTRDLTTLEVSPVVDADQFFTETEQKSDTQALFGQVEFRLDPELKATVGLRFNRDSKDFNGCTGDTGNGQFAAFLNARLRTNVFNAGQCTTFQLVGGVPVPGRVVDSLQQSSTASRLGLDWLPAPGWLLYGNISQGARPGNFPSLVGTSAQQFAPVRGEIVRAFELGLKAAAPAPGVSLQASAYLYNDFDKQMRGYVVDPVLGVLAKMVNVDKSRVEGVDLDASWRVDERWTLSGKAAYTHTEVREYVGPDRTGKQVDFAGQSFPLTPRTQALLSADYRLAVEQAGDAQLGLTIDFASKTKGSGTFIESPAFEVPQRTLVDLRFGFRPMQGRWAIFGGVRNLTDRYYWVNARQVNDANARYAGKPRTFRLGLSYDVG